MKLDAYGAELYAFITFNGEEFSILKKAIQEHSDTKFEIEVGGWFYGEEIKRKRNTFTEMKLRIREGQQLLHALESQKGELSLNLSDKISQILRELLERQKQINLSLMQNQEK